MFLMTGPATNAATMLVIASLGHARAGRVSGFDCRIRAGVRTKLDHLLAQTGLTITTPEHLHGHGPSWWQWAAAAVLSVFIARHYFYKLKRRYGTAPKAREQRTTTEY
ncbi:MAG: hypothetical protein IPH10_08175 [bacterium]|nr:hypothetical protein [bacterium]